MKEELRVSKKIAEILEQLIKKKGLVLPFLATAVGINGSCLFFKYLQAQVGLKAKLITGHMEGQGFGLPINMMVVDARGKALTFLIQKPVDDYEVPKRVGHA